MRLKGCAFAPGLISTISFRPNAKMADDSVFPEALEAKVNFSVASSLALRRISQRPLEGVPWSDGAVVISNIFVPKSEGGAGLSAVEPGVVLEYSTTRPLADQNSAVRNWFSMTASPWKRCSRP